MRHKSRFNRALALAATLGSVVSVGLITGSASADLGTGNTISATSGTAASTFSLAVVAPSNACQGDTASGNYKWSQFIAAASVDPTTITLTTATISAPGGFAERLYSTTGSPQSNKNTAVTTGQISGTSTLNFQTNTVPGNGAYNVGFVCTLAGATTRHWVTPITVTNWTSSTSFDWVFGAVPTAPSLTAVGGNVQITGVVTPVTATPAVTGYVVSATPTAGGSATTVNVPAAGPYAYTISGLTNGTPYNVVVTATNAAGNATSAPPVVATPALSNVTPAPVVTAASGPSPVTVSWVPSTGSPIPGLTPVTLVSHTVGFTPVGAAPAIASVTVPAGTNSTSVTGVVPNGYTVSVVGNYSNGQTTSPGNASFSFTNAQVLVQDIRVVRPAGALVLTQRCGVHGSAPAYYNALFGPTFPTLDQTAGADPDGANPPSAVGTAPLADALSNDPNSFGTGQVGPVGNQTAAGSPDSQFPQYPYPVDAGGNVIATYATNCAIDLGTASLITSGPSAGQYFRATGRIAQLTVVDTRNTDSGWTLNGRMGQFASTTAPTETFSGNLLGWVPEVTWDSNPNLDLYDTNADAGNIRLPVASGSSTGLGGSINEGNTTLANSLAKADAGVGLGMAVMDARLNLLIPVTADSGTYRGVLTFTIV